jgi:hypothetical protein
MYIRWQSRQRNRPQFGYWGAIKRVGNRPVLINRRDTETPDRHWRAILVENVRIDGKPTQRHIAYLAGFTESALVRPAPRRFLWERIEQQLVRLHNRFSPGDRKRIEAILIKKIGKPPTKAQRGALDRERQQKLGALVQGLGRR